MKYKLHISAYLEESNQLLVSFSSDATDREAADYQAMAFDIVHYGDVTAQQILDMIAHNAPTICSDITVAETYQSDDSRAEDLRAFVGQSFEYDENDLFNSQATEERQAAADADAAQVEEV